jgi:hypothetical protein
MMRATAAINILWLLGKETITFYRNIHDDIFKVPYPQEFCTCYIEVVNILYCGISENKSINNELHIYSTGVIDDQCKKLIF